MFKKYNPALFVLLALVIVVLVIVAVASNQNIAVLSPKGMIAQQQHDLIVIAVVLCSIVVIPVFVLMLFIAWRYRADSARAAYTPDWAHSRIIEFVWWAVPCAIILVLGIVAWQSSHSLDPSKPLASAKKPLAIQVVALQWKWLFIYPEQRIATVNYLQLPVDTPVQFEITADAPMNSFWIPQLGGQIYAMAGMSTHLHLMANEAGDYMGSSANISGKGFAGMKFTAYARPAEAFARWARVQQRSPAFLTANTYTQLARPSEDAPRTAYVVTEPELYNKIIMKYRSPGAPAPTESGHDHAMH